MNKPILVAGGTGLVGANLVLELKRRGLDFVATRHGTSTGAAAALCQPYDLTSFDQCLAATRDKGAVVLAAAVIHSAAQAKANPTGAILPNLRINAGLLEAAAINQVPTAVVISSTSVYPDADHPLKEDALDLNQPPPGIYQGAGGYNRYLESLARLYGDAHGMRVIILRPTAIYGPFDKFGDENAHVVPALINRALAKEDPFEVWGSPQVVRDFVFAPDLAGDIITALTDEAIPAGLPINAGSGQAIEIGQAVEDILSACDHAPSVRFNQDRPTSIPYRAVDMNRHQRYFGNGRTKFAEGVRQTVDWLRGREEA